MQLSKSFKTRSDVFRAALEQLDSEVEKDIKNGQREADQFDDDLSANDITNDNKLNIGNEGILGATAGLAGSFALSVATGALNLAVLPIFAGVGAGLAGQVATKQKEIEAISKHIKELTTEQGQKALKEGKITKDEYKKKFDVPWQDFFYGAILGSLFSFVYYPIKGHQLEDAVKELKEKTKELDEILKDAESTGMKKFKDKIANENLDENAQQDNIGQTQAGTTQSAGTPSTNETVSTDVATGDLGGAGGDDPTATQTDQNPGTQASDPTAASDNTQGQASDGAAVGEQGNAVADANVLDVDSVEVEGIEEDINDAQKVEVAMEGFHRELRQISIAACALEEITIALEATKQTGGPNIHTSVMYRTAMESLCDMIDVKQPFMPALEDMDTPDAKINGADKTAQGSKNLVQRMIAALRAGIERFTNWVGNLWRFITSAVQRTLQRAEKMNAGIANAEFSAEKVKGGTANVVQDTSNFVSKFPAYVESVKQFSNPATYDGYVELMNVCAKIGFSQDDENQKMEVVGKALEVLIKGFGAGMKHEQGTDGAQVFTRDLTGQTQLKIVVPIDPRKIAKLNTTIGLPEGVEVKKVEEVNPVNLGQAQSLLKQIIDALQQVTKMTSENGLKGVDDKLNQASATFKNKGVPPADPDGRVAKAVKYVTSILATRAKLPAYTINRSFVGVANAALNLISSSIKKGEAKPAAQPAATTTPEAAQA